MCLVGHCKQLIYMLLSGRGFVCIVETSIPIRQMKQVETFIQSVVSLNHVLLEFALARLDRLKRFLHIPLYYYSM